MTSWTGIVVACVVGVGCGGKHEPEPSPSPTTAAAAAAAPATPPSSPYRRDVDALEKDVVGLGERRDALTQQLDGAAASIAAATTESDREAARTKLAALRTQMDELAGLVTRSTKRADELRSVEPDDETPEAVSARKDVMLAQDRLDQLARDHADLDKQLTQASDKLIMAESDADRAAASAKLDMLLKEQAERKKAKR